MSIKTDAWVLYKGEGPNPGPTELVREEFEFEGPNSEEVLVKPLYGCWEGNMGHSMERKPIDICQFRGEDKVVTGNAGVVEVLEIGKDVTTVKPGDHAILFCNGEWDSHGYPTKIFGYDAKNTIGLLAKTTKLHQKQVIKIPATDHHELAKWAAFSLRYPTAFSNWRLASGMLRLQLNEDELPEPWVLGWGGGVTLATLHLARLHDGCLVAQVSSRESRRTLADKLGIITIDRNEFRALNYNEKKYKTDPEYKAAYKTAENRFLEIVTEVTEGAMANIFVDYVGAPVLRATLKALARQSVVTTAGWKEGMRTRLVRASECIARHQFVHTHYARYSEGVMAVRFAVENDWLPEPDPYIYSFDEIPKLATDYDNGDFVYFPVFKIND